MSDVINAWSSGFNGWEVIFIASGFLFVVYHMITLEDKFKREVREDKGVGKLLTIISGMLLPIFMFGLFFMMFHLISINYYVKENLEDFTEIKEEEIENGEIKQLGENECVLFYGSDDDEKNVQFKCDYLEEYEGDSIVVERLEKSKSVGVGMFGFVDEEVLDKSKERGEVWKVKVPEGEKEDDQ